MMNNEEHEISDSGAESNSGSSIDETNANLDDVFSEEFAGGPSAANSSAEMSDDQRVIEAEKEVLRARAEMENYRKRMQRDSELQLKYANMPLMRDLLDVWDNLQRALEAADQDDAGVAALREGVAMVSQQLTDLLAKYGCQRVDALGQPFDPNVHEAISQMPSEEYESGTVMNEVAVGYKLHDRVVRPSHVVVSTGAP